MNEAARDTADSASLDLPADQLEDDFRPVKGHRPAPRDAIHNDWSTSLGSGVAASLTGTVGTLNSSTISGSSDSDRRWRGLRCQPANCGRRNRPGELHYRYLRQLTHVTIGGTTYSIDTTLSVVRTPANPVLDGGSGTSATWPLRPTCARPC